MTDCQVCNCFQSAYGHFVRFCNTVLQPLLLLTVRVLWGYSLFVTGRGKLENHPNIVEFFTSLGIPAPDLNAWFVGGLECFGGLLLLVGLFSRPIAFVMTINMFVAYATAHHDELVGVFSDRNAFAAATPFAYLMTSLLVLAFGPGRVSLDALIRKYRCSSKPAGGCCSAK